MNTSRLIKILVMMAVATLATGCKLAVMVPSGGDVTSASGTRNCTGGSLCEHNITDTTFNETFTAVARPGYVFTKWNKGTGFYCGDSTNPTCTISNVGAGVIGGIGAYIAGGSFSYAMPLFDFVGIDTDGDGVKDHLDGDDDNDGLLDEDDPCPLQANPECGINEVSGVYYEDLYWRKEDGPYVIVGDVVIPEFFNLHIEAGAEVRRQSGSIVVNGNLYISGTEEEPVVLNNPSIVLQSSMSSIVDIAFAEFECISISNLSVYKPNMPFDRVTISNSRFSNCYNYFRKSLVGTIVIEKNVFDGSKSHFEGNLSIQNNLFKREVSDTEILVSGVSLFNYNTILFHPSTGGINSITIDTQYSSSNDIDATNNYWGTTDYRVIDLIIYDEKDTGNSAQALINYNPFLNAPSSGTPSS